MVVSTHLTASQTCQRVVNRKRQENINAGLALQDN